MLGEVGYSCVIERGHARVNDIMIDFLKTKIVGKFLDIGANAGWLVSELPNGVGVDNSGIMLREAHSRGRPVIGGRAEALPFKPNTFDMAVLSCVLEQCVDWRYVLNEALRVARVVIGFTPYPGESVWGYIGGLGVVKSVVAAGVLCKEFVCRTERVDGVHTHYYFEIKREGIW